MVWRVRPAFVVACAVLVTGCAIRYDSGVSRVGVGLWGFGDPPGANWSLDWPPRREMPELPPRREMPELPARSPREIPDLPPSFRTNFDDAFSAGLRDVGAVRDDMIDDDRCPAVVGESPARCMPQAARADLRGGAAPRR
jgi:hypothetical protein